MTTLYNYLADAVVVIHAAYIGFVIAGLVLILLGAVFRWEWVRNFWFRLLHFLMILVVVVQALLSVECPLTTLENYWRQQGGSEVYQGSFIGHWVHELIFYDAPSWVFKVCYTAFGSVVLGTLFLVPPRWPWTGRRLAHEGLGDRGRTTAARSYRT